MSRSHDLHSLLYELDYKLKEANRIFKFRYGDLVRVKTFNNRIAIVEGNSGSAGHNSYSLYLKKGGGFAWVYEDDLELIEHFREALLPVWKAANLKRYKKSLTTKTKVKTKAKTKAK